MPSGAPESRVLSRTALPVTRAIRGAPEAGAEFRHICFFLRSLKCAKPQIARWFFSAAKVEQVKTKQMQILAYPSLCFPVIR
jgi:hypothetical protein